jgi:selenide,water dikinase
MTDVTGFGLLGHLTEMMEGSNLSASIVYNKIPIIPAVRNYIAQKTIPGATARNWSSISAGVVLGAGVDEAEAKLLLPDPQTNGGLLIAVAPIALKEVQTILQEMGIEYTASIGECTAAKEKRIYIN